MKEEEIRSESIKAANRSQFMSNYIYDHKSYEDGYYEGMKNALEKLFGDNKNRQIKCQCKKAEFTRTVDDKCNPLCAKCGRQI